MGQPGIQAPVIYAADIGSVATGNFGWARLDPDQGAAQVERNNGTEIDKLADAVAHDVQVGKRRVALGFECPLFVPVPDDPVQLGAARVGEGNRPFSGGPGKAALVTGLVQVAWVLRELHARCPVSAFLDWDEFSRAETGLLLWEAFVTGNVKAATHVDDASIAAETFRDSLPDPPAANAVAAENSLSLVGAALLWSGWSQDTALLHRPCLVIKAESAVVDSHAVTKEVGPAVAKHAGVPSSLRDKVIEVAARIPAGRWTSYGDIADMIRASGHPAIARGVGAQIGAGGIPNDHRILNAQGRFPAAAPPDHVEKLKAEGIRLIEGCADPTQRWRPKGDEAGEPSPALSPGIDDAQQAANEPTPWVVLLDDRSSDGSSRHMTASRDADGTLRIEGHDLGSGTEIISDDGEYEYCYSIDAADVPTAVAALGGDPGADILDLLRERWSGPAAYQLDTALRGRVPYSFWSWP